MLTKYLQLLAKLQRLYGTLDPIILANKLNIEIRYVPFGNNPKGMYTKIKGTPMILVNESIEHHPERKFVIAHELYHFLEHEENAAYYIQSDRNRSKYETEANKFAIVLLTNLYIEETREYPETIDEVSYKYGVSYKENMEKLF